MKVLATGGTGNVGGKVIKELLKRGAEVRLLSRKQPEEDKLPSGLEVALGDLLDPSVGGACDETSWTHAPQLRGFRERDH